MKILDRVHVVGGGGFGLSNPTDCHIYLIDGGSEYALIDAGSGIDTPRIVRNLVEMGFDPSLVRTILLTHSHWDHARGARSLAEATGAKIAIHHNGRRVLVEDLWRNHLVTVKGGFDVEQPVEPDILLADGDVVRVGDAEITVLETTGHTQDAVCYLMQDSGRRLAFTGDTLVGEGELGVARFDSDFIAYKRGIDRLHEYAPDAILPGHRIFTLQYGAEYTKKAAELLSGTFAISDARPAFYPSWWLNLAGHDIGRR